MGHCPKVILQLEPEFTAHSAGLGDLTNTVLRTVFSIAL